MRRAGVAVALALGLGLGGVAPAGAQERTIYSSLPLQGDAREQSEAILRGERLALEQAGGRAGGFPIRFVSLDDSTANAETWTPEAVFRNARRAARDDSAIAYIGDFNSGASAISIPVLNEAGIPQVSPSNTAIGLTRREGADRGEPEKYYPSGVRSYARVAPADHLQAAALARLVQELEVRRVYVVDDGELYGRGLSLMVRKRLAARGIRVAGRSRLGRGGRNAAAIARRVRRSRAGAMVYTGISVAAGVGLNPAARLWSAVHRRNRRIELIGGDGVAEPGFTQELLRSERPRTRVTVATLALSAYPAAAQPVIQALRERDGGRDPDPYALYGYEAMSLVLDAINRAGAKSRDKFEVGRQIFATRDRDSILGRYSIDRNGDTTLRTYGVYRVTRGGELEFERAVDSGAR